MNGKNMIPVGEARFIKKKVKTGTVDIHPTENALVVNYEVEALILGDDGHPMIGDQKKCQKLIRFHSLNPSTNCANLAKDVIAKCKLIHPDKLDEVQHLLRYLQYRKQCAPSIMSKSAEGVELISPLEENSPAKVGEKANIFNLEDYIELLYDEMPDKIKGSGLILQLCEDSSNLDELTKNESLLSVLSRVLREDWKKSLELSINLVGVFEKLSEYTVYQPIVLQHKIGSLCIDVVMYELQKLEDFKVGADTVIEETSDAAKLSFRSKLPVPRSAKSAVSPEVQKVRSQIPVKNSSSNNRCSSFTSTEEKQIERTELTGRKLEIVIKKQDQLFNLCFSLLLDLSENEKIGDKMRKRNIIPLLLQMLSRKSGTLLVTVLKFLQKLSVYKENIEYFISSANIIEKLPKILFFSQKDANLLNHLLPLLFNLSFERKLCEQMIQVGFLSEFIKMTANISSVSPVNKKCTFGLLYHFTMDDRVKSMFAYTDGMNTIIELILNPNLGNDPILKALCVNLSLNSKCAEALCDHRVISTIMETAFNNKDVICMKIMRNIVSHSNTKHMFELYASEVAKSLKVHIHTHRHFTCECIGFLASLLTTDVDFYLLFNKYQLFPLIKQCFSEPEFVTDDIRLELLLLLGTVSYEETMADCLFQNDILPLLIKTIKDKQEDDEIVLQVLFIFYQVLQHPLTRDYVTKHTDAPLYFIDLLHDNNPNIRKICRACLDIIKDFDESWTDRVKIEKFQWHNSHWLEMIQSQVLNSSSNNYEKQFGENSIPNSEDIMPQYNLLQQSLMFQSGSHLSLSVDGSMEVLSNIINSEDSSQSISGYNSDADIDTEIMKKLTTPCDEIFDLSERFGDLIIDESNELDLV